MSDIPSNPARGEARRFDRGAWLTLIAAAVLLLWPLALSILFAGTPSDGWASYSAEGFFDGQFVMNYSLTGQPSPLRTDDIIVAIDGQPLVKGQLPPLPTPLVAGETVRYTVERNGQTFKADIPLVQIGLRAYGAIWLHDPLKSLATLVTLVIAAAVFFLRPQLPAARFMLIAYTYLAGNAILEIVGNPFVYALPPAAIFLASFYVTGYAWAYYASLILLVLVFPVTLPPMRRFPRALTALIYLVPFIMMGLSVPHYPATTQSDWQLLIGGVTFISYAALTAVVTVGAIIYNLRTVKDPATLAQVRWMVFGLGIGVAVTNLLDTVPRLQPWSYITALALPIALAIGILRYRLFDIDVIIRRTTSYAILTGILLLVYFGTIVVLQRLLSPHHRGIAGGRRALHAAHRRALPAPAPPRPGRHRPPLLPQEVRRRAGAGAVRRHRARRDGPRCINGRIGARDPGDDAAGVRQRVVEGAGQMNQTSNERRFDRGAWLHLILTGVLLLCVALGSLVYRLSLPTDGWRSREPEEIGSVGYIYEANIMGAPSGLNRMIT